MIWRYGMIKLLPHPNEPQKLFVFSFLPPTLHKIVDTFLISLMVPDVNKNGLSAGYRGLFKQRSLQAAGLLRTL